jgi:universal stress protein E
MKEAAMRKVRRILVAVKDPHARALPGIAKAAQVARATGASLELFHGLTAPIWIGPPYTQNETPAQHVEHTRTRCLGRLERLAMRLRRQGITVTTAVESDYPAYEAIIRRARKFGADLIVADCHAGRHLAPFLMQLTDWELLRHSPMPVLLVKNARPYRNPVVLAAIDPLHAYAKPGKLDAEILDAGLTLKRAMRGTLHAMNAFPVPPGASPADQLDLMLADSLQKQAETIARKGFEQVIRNFDLPRNRQHLVPEHPFDAIQNVARRTRADIVVMGAISRSGFKRLFIGNTAERVLDELRCDVLIVKPRHFASRVQNTQRGMRFVAPPPSLMHV